MGHLKLPAGKKIAVNLGTDFIPSSVSVNGRRARSRRR